MKTIRCHAFVSADDVIINAVVTYDAETGVLLSVVPFERETPSTSDFDGIVIAGMTQHSDSALASIINRNRFRESLRDLCRMLEPSCSVRLVRM